MSRIIKMTVAAGALAVGVPSASAPLAAVAERADSRPAAMQARAAPRRVGAIESTPRVFEPVGAAIGDAAGCDLPGLEHVDPLICGVIEARIPATDWAVDGEGEDALLGSATGSILGRIPAEPINVAITILGQGRSDCPARDAGSDWDTGRAPGCDTLDQQILYEDLERQIASRTETGAGRDAPLDPSASP